jgi:hypothetical protein
VTATWRDAHPFHTDPAQAALPFVGKAWLLLAAILLTFVVTVRFVPKSGH